MEERMNVPECFQTQKEFMDEKVNYGIENYRKGYGSISERIYRRPPIDLCMEYCKAHNIEPRAHCLNYDPFSPNWLMGEPVQTIKEKSEERMCILSEKYIGMQFHMFNRREAEYENTRFF